MTKLRPPLGHVFSLLISLFFDFENNYPEPHFINSFKSWYSNSLKSSNLPSLEFFGYQNPIFNKNLVAIFLPASHFCIFFVFKMFLK